MTNTRIRRVRRWLAVAGIVAALAVGFISGLAAVTAPVDAGPAVTAAPESPVEAGHLWPGHRYTLTPTAHDICAYVKPIYASTTLQAKNFSFLWHPMVGCMWWLPSSGNAACWMIDRYAPNGSAWIPCPLP